MTGTNPADVPSTAVYRLVCYYILGHLNEDSLMTACNSLVDVYSWQLEQARAVRPAPPEIRIISARPTVKYVERQPFLISND